ncbi:proP [Symbiodinium sp. KB8]|nr:proP [Symbiodinium sp. KB8]
MGSAADVGQVVKVYWALLLGNILEWYEFAIFSFLEPYLEVQFFNGSAISTWLGFACTFAARPFGGIVLGLLGDIFGRKVSTFLSICGMVIGTVGQGLVPSYQSGEVAGTIGLVLLVALRLLQGICTGGEIAAVSTYITEVGPKRSLARSMALIGITANIGFLLAQCASYLTREAVGASAMESWAWRIPFVIAVIPGVIATAGRRCIPESQVFLDAKTQTGATSDVFDVGSESADANSGDSAGSQGAASQPVARIKHLVKSQWPSLLVGIGSVAGASVLQYGGFLWGNVFLKKHGTTPDSLIAAGITARMLAAVLAPLVGWLADTVGVGWIQLAGTFALTLGGLPLFLVQKWMPESFGVVMAAYGVGYGIIFAPVGMIIFLLVVELFPVEVRNAGVGLSYNIGFCVFGGDHGDELLNEHQSILFTEALSSFLDVAEASGKGGSAIQEATETKASQASKDSKDSGTRDKNDKEAVKVCEWFPVMNVQKKFCSDLMFTCVLLTFEGRCLECEAAIRSPLPFLQHMRRVCLVAEQVFPVRISCRLVDFKNLAPTLERFPALKTTGVRPPLGDLDEIDEADEAAAWAASTPKVSDRREVREPSFKLDRPWLSGARRPRLLERSVGGLCEAADDAYLYAPKNRGLTMSTMSVSVKGPSEAPSRAATASLRSDEKEPKKIKEAVMNRMHSFLYYHGHRNEQKDVLQDATSQAKDARRQRTTVGALLEQKEKAARTVWAAAVLGEVQEVAAQAESSYARLVCAGSVERHWVVETSPQGVEALPALACSLPKRFPLGSSREELQGNMPVGVFTIFDCRTDGLPFAARILHEVIHHWACASRDLATFGPDKTIQFGLSFVRRGGVEPAVPWGTYGRDVVLTLLDNLQASWINDCDVTSGELSSQEEALCLALESLASGGEELGDACAGRAAVEVWSFLPRKLVCCSAASERLRGLQTAGIDVTVVKLADESFRSDDDGQGRLIDIKEVSMPPTRLAVLRHLRSRLSVKLMVNLELPGKFPATVEEWKVDAAYQENLDPCFNSVACSCSPILLLMPGQHEAATAQLSTSQFHFQRFVRAGGIDPCHFYGIPLVARPVSKVNLSSRIRNRDDAADSNSFEKLACLAQGQAALYASKVCPLELKTGCRTFHWLASVGSESRDSVLVLRGLANHHTTSLLGLQSQAVGEMSDGLNEEGVAPLGLDALPQLSVYNPLCAESVLHAAMLEVPWPAAMPSEVSRGRGGGRARGRGRGRGEPRPKVQAGLQTVEMQPVSYVGAKVAADLMPAANAGPAAPPALPTAVEPANTASAKRPRSSLGSAGSLAPLASLLCQWLAAKGVFILDRAGGCEHCCWQLQVRLLTQLKDQSDGTIVAGYRDRVNRYEVDVAQECFVRYFHSKSSSLWNADVIIEALADFGIKGDQIGFNNFCSIIEEARSKMRSTRSLAVFQAWKYADKEDAGGLKPDAVMQLLEDLQLAFGKDSLERQNVEAMVSDCRTDPATGLIGLTEVEFLVSAVREYMMQTQRSQERKLQVEYQLSDSMFQEFRSQLIRFHESFVELDDDDSGALDENEAMNLLTHFGCLSNVSSMSIEKKLQAEEIIEWYLNASEDHTLSFSRFLSVVKRLRTLGMDEKMDAVESLFNHYDRDRSGKLTIKDVCQILMHLEIKPRSVLEQENMAQLIEEADSEGSGHLNVNELLLLVQRINERIAELDRMEILKKAQALNFTRKQASTLRETFEELDEDREGLVPINQVEQALAKMRWQIPGARLQRYVNEIDVDGNGHLDFLEFLHLMRRVLDDVQNSGMKLQPDGTLVTDIAREDDEHETGGDRKDGKRLSGERKARRSARKA